LRRSRVGHPGALCKECEHPGRLSEHFSALPLGKAASQVLKGHAIHALRDSRQRARDEAEGIGRNRAILPRAEPFSEILSMSRLPRFSVTVSTPS
jgi:hypothetical protein